MSYQTIEVRKLSPIIGAEIHEVDLSKPLGNQQFQEIHDALMENCVIFFRRQQLSIEQHKAFGARFGKLLVHPAAKKDIEGHPEILVIKADETNKHVAGEEWHSDVSCEAEPPMGSLLYMTEVPPCGGDTMFSNMYAAYDALSDSMKSFLTGLTATHSGSHVYNQKGYGENPRLPSAEHPVVRTHPVTRRPCLFVNRGFTTRIMQLKRAESSAVLEMLYRHCETPEFQCRFKWEVGSLAFWDNRCAQHHALFDYWPNRRYGHRVTVAGDKPFYEAT